MNRKQFLKSLLVLPIVGFLGKNIFAKEKTVEEQISEAAKDPNLVCISESKWEKPNPYKLPFVNSKNYQIKHIYDITDINICSDLFIKIITNLFGNDCYYLTYLDPLSFESEFLYRKTSTVIIGNKLDWWSPIKINQNFVKEKEQYVIIDKNSIKNISTYLTIEDKRFINDFLLVRKHNHNL